MINAGGNPFIQNKLGQTTETLLLQPPHVESNLLAELLTTFEQLKNETPDERKTSLVHEAVRANNLKKLRIFCKIGAPLNTYNRKGQSPLVLAEELGHGDIFKFLHENSFHQKSSEAKYFL